MSTLLENHLEQISLSSVAIGDLAYVTQPFYPQLLQADHLFYSFPPPRIFTNAILHSHDVTALIRDTEAHERALFTIAAEQEEAQPVAAKIARRSTIHGANGPALSGNLQKQAQRATLATLLSGDVGDLVKRQAPKKTEQGEVDIELLLNGAEKLCRI